jgi:hypothetical protein
VLFATRLLDRAEREGNVSFERIKGVVRWRHAMNRYADDEIGKAIAALQCVGSVMVAGGWSDFRTGRKGLSAAHIGEVFVALRPYNKQLLLNALTPLGWKANGQTWRRNDLLGGKTVNLNITQDLDPFQWRLDSECTGDIFHAEGQSLTLLLAHRALNASGPQVTLKLLDRILDDLPDRSALEALRDHADQLRCRKALERALALVERICGGEFEARLPHRIVDAP